MPDTSTSDVRYSPAPAVIPVSLLNRLARERLEAAFPLCWVAGEVSNLTYAASGHVYFSLKDAYAQVRCVMFRNRAQLLGWRLENGQHLEARVLVTLYEARGDFQLNVESARKAGVGSLFERFVALKEKLEREGLFAAADKRPLPAYPRRVGVVTSLQAAALKDVLSTLRRRAPQVGVVVYPTPVQGEGAGAQIARAVAQAGARSRDDGCEVLIVCRGGGSLEDLWAFNDEALARAIHACPLPVISGVGHETDFTIADFAADQRAPTPTAAAELAAPQRSALAARLGEWRRRLERHARQTSEQRSVQLDALALRLQHPAQRLAQQRADLAQLGRRLDQALAQTNANANARLALLRQRLLHARPETRSGARALDALGTRLAGHWQTALHQRRAELARLAAGLDQLNPDAVLERGYAIVNDYAGRIVRDASALEPNDCITVFFHAGRADATVISTSGQAAHHHPPQNNKPR